MNDDDAQQARAAVDAVYRSDGRRIFATLVRLLGDFELVPIVVGDAIDCLTEFETIDAMNQLKERQSVAHLVFLEMTDEMPAKVRW